MAAIQDETRVALVTGATRGIGQAIADSLAAAGHTVIGTATSDTGVSSRIQRLSSQTAAAFLSSLSNYLSSVSIPLHLSISLYTCHYLFFLTLSLSFFFFPIDFFPFF